MRTKALLVALAVAAAVTGVAVLLTGSDDPAPRDVLAAEPEPTLVLPPTPSVSAVLPTAVLPTAVVATPPPALPNALPTAVPTVVRRPPLSTPVATLRPTPTPTPYVEGSECQHKSARTGLVTVTLEICAFAAGEDQYTVTMTTAGDQVFRTVHVDRADGSTEPYEQLTQYSCAQDTRPKTLYHGSRSHEWASGTWDVVATVVVHDCSPDDNEDTDSPHEASVTFRLQK